MAALVLDEPVDFFQVKKNIQQGKDNTQDGDPTLEFSVFIQKNIYDGNAYQGNRNNKYPDIKCGVQILKRNRLSGRHDIAAVERKFDREKGTNGGQQQPDRLHSLQHTA
jgi:hypothetical protein